MTSHTETNKSQQKIFDNWKNRLPDISTFVFIGPALGLLGLLIIYPIIATFYLSFTDWDGISRNWNFIGIDNYLKFFDDANFIAAFKNSIIYVIGFTTFSIALGLFFALIFNTQLKGSTIIKSAIYLPIVLPSIIVALQWRWMYDPEWGSVNYILRLLGLESLTKAWLGDSDVVLFAIMVVAIWRQVPFVMVVYLAGLTGIPIELLEAAEIDGASYFQSLRYIVLPMLKGVTSIVGIMTLIVGLKVFDLVYILTRGGPGNASEVLANLMYFKAFQEFRQGYGSAISVVLFLLILPAAVYYVRTILRSDEGSYGR
jgi:ABC-type sugar transport system permease subunit